MVEPAHLETGQCVVQKHIPLVQHILIHHFGALNIVCCISRWLSSDRSLGGMVIAVSKHDMVLPFDICYHPLSVIVVHSWRGRVLIFHGTHVITFVFVTVVQSHTFEYRPPMTSRLREFCRKIFIQTDQTDLQGWFIISSIISITQDNLRHQNYDFQDSSGAKLVWSS